MVFGFIPYNPFECKKKVPVSQIQNIQKTVIEQIAEKEIVLSSDGVQITY